MAGHGSCGHVGTLLEVGQMGHLLTASTVASRHYLQGNPSGHHRAPPAYRQKTLISFLSQPDLRNLAYKKLKGRSPGVIFSPGSLPNMNDTKALAFEEFCKSLGNIFIRGLYVYFASISYIWRGAIKDRCSK